MRDELSAEELRAWAPRPDPGLPDLRLPGYSGFQLVAQGGEGAVYRARQDGLGRDVAIKALQAVDPATQARFRRELEITVRLGRQHPHIVTVLDTGTLPDGRPCIVMEFYDRGSLHDRLRAHGPLPVAEVVAAGVAVADALAFAHDQGILHRDVKPQNVLVLPTSYVLADFGIARGADAGHSASLQMVSYRHAAPQMIDGATPAAADDLWSLGSTLFTLLTGVPPFAGDNPDEDTVLPYLDRVRSAEPRPLVRQDVPAALVEIITRCLRKRREDRFPDAATLRDALAAVSADLRRWQPPVDPDATSIAPSSPPDRDATSIAADGATSIAADGATSIAATPADAVPDDFGPSPTPPAEPEPPAETPPPVAEPRGTMTGRLADLTLRRSDPEPPEFGPGAGSAPQPGWAPEPASDAGPRPGWVPEPSTSAGPRPEGAHASSTGPRPARAAEPTNTTGLRPEWVPEPTSEGDPRSERASEHANGPTSEAGPPRPERAQAHSSGAGQRSEWLPEPSSDAGSRSGWVPETAGGGDVTAQVSGGGRPPDVPTVPKLSPMRFEGFPAMPEAHEWEYDTAPQAVEQVGRPRWRGFVIAGIVAAVVGVGIGVLASRDVVETPPVDPSTTVAIPPGGDPAVAPVLTKVDDNGDSAKVSWTDPTNGQAQFVLYDVTVPGGVPDPIVTIAPGLTSFVATGLDPRAARYCFQLIAIGVTNPSTQVGASNKLCVSR